MLPVIRTERRHTGTAEPLVVAVLEGCHVQTFRKNYYF